MRSDDHRASIEFAYENLARYVIQACCQLHKTPQPQTCEQLEQQAAVLIKFSCYSVDRQKACSPQTCSAQRRTNGKPYRTLISSLCEFIGISLSLWQASSACLVAATCRTHSNPVACRYYEEKGFGVIFAARVLNVLALGFTVVFSGFLLLSVKWAALHSECVVAGKCDIAEVCSCRRMLIWMGVFTSHPSL